MVIFSKTIKLAMKRKIFNKKIRDIYIELYFKINEFQFHL